MCINLIVQYLRNLGIKAGKKYEKKRKILASEVSQKAVQKTTSLPFSPNFEVRVRVKSLFTK